MHSRRWCFCGVETPFRSLSCRVSGQISSKNLNSRIYYPSRFQNYSYSSSHLLHCFKHLYFDFASCKLNRCYREFFCSRLQCNYYCRAPKSTSSLWSPQSSKSTTDHHYQNCTWMTKVGFTRESLDSPTCLRLNYSMSVGSCNELIVWIAQPAQNHYRQSHHLLIRQLNL